MEDKQVLRELISAKIQLTADDKSIGARLWPTSPELISALNEKCNEMKLPSTEIRETGHGWIAYEGYEEPARALEKRGGFIFHILPHQGFEKPFF